MVGSALVWACGGTPPPSPVSQHVAASRAIQPAPRAPVNEALLAAIRASQSSPEFDPATVDPLELAPIPELVRARTTRPAGSGSPPLPRESVLFVLRKNAGRFRDCYRQGLVGAPRLEGRIVVDFSIAPDGKVWRVTEADHSLPSRRVRICVLERFFELDFGATGDPGVRVRYPLNFSRNGESALGELRDADRMAEPPPPGFAAALRAGRSIDPPAPPAPAPASAPAASPTSCDPRDPLCADL